jgi:putative aldouronate transport system substrate-binding protein
MKKKNLFLCVGMVILVLPAFAGGSSQAQRNQSADIGFNPTGLPIVTKPFTFSGVVNRRPLHGPFADMTVLKELEKKTGVTVQYIEIPEANFTERKNLMLASNDLPDVFLQNLTDSDVLRYGQQGVFLPLEDLVERYALRLKAIFTQRPDIKKYVTAPDGHIYVLPRIQEASHRTNGDNMFINKVWLDKLGLKMPTSFEEYYTVLKAFKEKDPNGNGKQDEIPFSFVGRNLGDQYNIFSLFAGFGMHDNGDHVMVNNKKVYFTANSPEYRNALVYFNRLYREGLIDPEAFTHDVKQYSAKGMGPEVLFGSFMDYFDENAVGNDRAKNVYTTLPPLKGPSGKQGWNYDPSALLARDNFAITSRAKNPEVLMRWVDECYDRDMSFALYYGAWDINIRKEGDRVVQIPPPAGISADEFRYTHAPVNSLPFVIYEADFKSIGLGENYVRKYERLDIYRKYFPALDEIYPKMYMLPEEENELAIIRTDIRDYVEQMRAKFIVGSESIESGWNTYLQQLNQMGLPRYVELHQKALDRYNGN